MLRPNQKEISLVNRRIVYDFLKVRDVIPETFEANEELRKAVRGTRTKQRQDKKQKRKRNRNQK